MIRTRKFIDGHLILVLMFLGYLTLSSCNDSSNVLPADEQPIPVQLSISLDDAGYTTDGELIPMNTRGEEQSYYVTRILNHKLVILKEKGDYWIVQDVRADVIKIPEFKLLKNGVGLELSDTGKNYVLPPGNYRFAFYLNGVLDANKIEIGAVISKDDEESITTESKPRSDFFYAQQDIEIEKSESLNQPKEYTVKLQLKRNSALIRFILAGDWGDLTDDPTVKCNLSGKVCVGIDLSGNSVVGEIDLYDLGVDIRRKNAYPVNNELLFFTSLSKNRNNLSLFTIDDAERQILLTITNIGDEYDASFSGNHPVEIPICKNEITTVLIRKNPEDVGDICIDLNPDLKSNWNTTYPPLDFVELNN